MEVGQGTKSEAKASKQTEITLIENMIAGLASRSRLLWVNLNDIIRRTMPDKPSDAEQEGTGAGYSDYSIDRVNQRLSEMSKNLDGIRELVNELEIIL